MKGVNRCPHASLKIENKFDPLWPVEPQGGCAETGCTSKALSNVFGWMAQRSWFLEGLTDEGGTPLESITLTFDSCKWQRAL